MYVCIGRRKIKQTHLLTVPHGTLAYSHEGEILRSIQPHDAHFGQTYPGHGREVVVPRITQIKLILLYYVTEQLTQPNTRRETPTYCSS